MRTILLANLKPAAPREAIPSSDPLEVVVKVRVAGYVPPAVTVRAQIDDHLFTALVRADQVSAIEQDPRVESVATSQKLRLIE
jgi:hypothetical protein